MREIKFRCWNAFSRVMHDWDEMVEKNKIHLLKNENKSYICEQYTGQEDSNGNEMCQGDICQVSGLGNCIVDIDCFYGIVFKQIGGDCQEVPLIDCIAEDESYFVIANIHQNPELLK